MIYHDILEDRPARRIAETVRSALRLHRHTCLVEAIRQSASLASTWDRMAGYPSRLEKAVARGWMGAASRVARDLGDLLTSVPYGLQGIQRFLGDGLAPVPSMKDLVDDLVQVAREFGGVGYDASSGILAVQTDPIVLDGVHLGPFEIRLALERLSAPVLDRALAVKALEPHPAQANDAVTHPHVSDEHLCAGDGAASLEMALEEGRLCDGLLLVRSVLSNYNGDSPYVSLEDWDARTCRECGRAYADDDGSWCAGCDEEYCLECTTYCRRCNETLCLGCIGTCPVCEERVCGGCLTTCPDCGRRLCGTCLEERLCSCHEKENEDDSTAEVVSPPEKTHAIQAPFLPLVEPAA